MKIWTPEHHKKQGFLKSLNTEIRILQELNASLMIPTWSDAECRLIHLEISNSMYFIKRIHEEMKELPEDKNLPTS